MRRKKERESERERERDLVRFEHFGYSFQWRKEEKQRMILFIDSILLDCMINA